MARNQPAIKNGNGTRPGQPGKPRTWTKHIEDEIIDRLESGETLLDICAAPNMPDRRTVLRWIEKEAMVDFASRLTRARINQTHALADEALALARSKKLTSKTAYGMKVRIDTLLSLAARMNPAAYSERFNAALVQSDRINVHNVISLTPPAATLAVEQGNIPLETQELKQLDNQKP
jgi:hypothetical protein